MPLEHAFGLSSLERWGTSVPRGVLVDLGYFDLAELTAESLVLLV